MVVMNTYKNKKNPGFSFFLPSIFVFLVIACILFSPNMASAVQVTLEWDANSEPDLAGYRAFLRQEDQNYNFYNPAWEGTETTCTIFDLDENISYYFVVRAYNTSDLESGNSNEVVYQSDYNAPPTANAGPDQTVYEGDTVILDGSNSSDQDDDIAFYQWNQVTGTQVALSDTEAVHPTFTAPDVEGSGGQVLTFQLTVTDETGLTSTDTCIVVVNNDESPPDPGSEICHNGLDDDLDGLTDCDDPDCFQDPECQETPGLQPPVADAGLDHTVMDNDGDGFESVTLDGSGSTDDVMIVSYEWSEGSNLIADGVNPEVTLAVGVHMITLTVTDDDGETDTDTVEIIVNATGEAIIRINAGGGEYRDGNGNIWSADYGYNTGREASFLDPISGTTDDFLFQSERWDPSSSPELEYSFDLTNGDYLVNLYFANICAGTAGVGLRVFDVVIEDELVLDELDIYGEVGDAAALVKEFNVTVTDGQLNIRFLHEVEDPKISAIEIISE